MQELASSPKNGWEVYRSPEHRKAMYELADAYMDFLTASKTERETVSEVIARPFAGWTKDVKDWEL